VRAPGGSKRNQGTPRFRRWLAPSATLRTGQAGPTPRRVGRPTTPGTEPHRTPVHSPTQVVHDRPRPRTAISAPAGSTDTEREPTGRSYGVTCNGEGVSEGTAAATCSRGEPERVWRGGTRLMRQNCLHTDDLERVPPERAPKNSHPVQDPPTTNPNPTAVPPAARRRRRERSSPWDYACPYRSAQHD
jgi:hypothetical protein